MTFDDLQNAALRIGLIGYDLTPDGDYRALIEQIRKLNAIMAVLNRRQLAGQNRWPGTPDDLIA